MGAKTKIYRLFGRLFILDTPLSQRRMITGTSYENLEFDDALWSRNTSVQGWQPRSEIGQKLIIYKVLNLGFRLQIGNQSLGLVIKLLAT